jgi:hypothetical protein
MIWLILKDGLARSSSGRFRLELVELVLEPRLVAEQLLLRPVCRKPRLLEGVDPRLHGVASSDDVLELLAKLLPLPFLLVQLCLPLRDARLPLVDGLVVLVADDVDLCLGEAEILIGRVPLGLQLGQLGLCLLDLRAVLGGLLLASRHLGFDRLELVGADLAERVLDLLLGERDLEVAKLDLVLLPFARVVGPDHERQHQQESDRACCEQQVELERPLGHLRVAARLGFSHARTSGGLSRC